MSLERFSVSSVLSAHWKGLTKPPDSAGVIRPDRWARGVLVLFPAAAGLLTGGLGVSLNSPAIFVGALSLMTGALLTVFAQLSTLRLKLTEWFGLDELRKRAEKDALDESVAHVLTAALFSLAATGVTIGAVIFDGRATPIVGPVLAAVAVSLISYVLLLLIMLVPRLYGAYVGVNDVSDELNGQFDDRTNRSLRRLS